jgi:hypothetical protein
MAPYHHHVNTHRRSKNARLFKKVVIGFVSVAIIITVGISADWLLTNIRASDTKVSVESSATVQSARINIFQTPYFSFQADSNWREVTDELNLGKTTDGSQQYLYRRYTKNFIEHELWITVNMPEGYNILKHNIPTRVYPVQVEPDGSLTRISGVSESCSKALSEKDTNLQPHILTLENVTFYCDPNNNGYQVAVGVPGKTERIEMPKSDNGSNFITITYRNTSAIPDARQLESIIQTFRSI